MFEESVKEITEVLTFEKLVRINHLFAINVVLSCFRCRYHGSYKYLCWRHGWCNHWANDCCAVYHGFVTSTEQSKYGLQEVVRGLIVYSQRSVHLSKLQGWLEHVDYTFYHTCFYFLEFRRKHLPISIPTYGIRSQINLTVNLYRIYKNLSVVTTITTDTSKAISRIITKSYRINCMEYRMACHYL